MILRRYIHREIVEKLGWIIGLLLLIITSNRFVNYLADAAAGTFPIDLVFQTLFMKMLTTLPKLLPLAVFVAVILGLSRLARDKELAIVTLSGGARQIQLVSVLQFSLLFSLIVFVTSFFISPWAAQNMERLNSKAEIEVETTGLRAGKFNEFSQGDQVMYIEQAIYATGQMENIFLQARRDERFSVLNSDSAKFETLEPSGNKYILFEDGRRYTSHSGALDYRITRYKTYAVLIKQNEEISEYVRMESLPTSTLLGSDIPKHKAELQWRLSFVLSSLLLPLLAVALSRYSFNEQKYLSAFVAVLIYIIYSNMLSISKTLLKRDEISPFIGLWWVHLALVVLIVLVFQFPRIRQGARQIAER